MRLTGLAKGVFDSQLTNYHHIMNQLLYVDLCYLIFSGWLSSHDDPLGYVDKIDRRIEDTTGLDMSTAEQLQVQ